MGGGGHSEQTSTPVFQQFAGAFGNNDYSKSTQLAGMAEKGLNANTPFTSAFDKPLEEALLNPSFMPTSQADQNMLNSLMDLTAGRGAVRGLGAPTQSSLAQTIAPELLQMQQGQVQGLTNARAQDIGLRGQDIQQQQGSMQALLNLIGLAMPQVVVGASTTVTSKSGGLVQGLLDPFNQGWWQGGKK